MPTRLRVVAQLPNGEMQSGSGVIRLLRRTHAGADWPRVDWAVMAGELREMSLFVALWVWRERRGISHKNSKFHRTVGRYQTHIPAVRAARRRSLQAQQTWPPRPRRIQAIPDATPTRPSAPRLGIFA